MKSFSRFIKISFLALLVIFLLRGWLFHLTVGYQPVGERKEFALTDPSFKEFLLVKDEKREIEPIIRQALEMTADRLRFTTGKNETDPNRLFYTKTAHCVGYAAFFATTCNELIRQAGLENQWQARPVVGKISFLGMDLHRLSKSPFFRDHDFNIVADKTTGKQYYVDASVKDCLGISYVKE